MKVDLGISLTFTKFLKHIKNARRPPIESIFYRKCSPTPACIRCRSTLQFIWLIPVILHPIYGRTLNSAENGYVAEDCKARIQGKSGLRIEFLLLFEHKINGQNYKNKRIQ